MKYRFIFLVLFLFALSECKNNATADPVTNQNKCTLYACPVHPDKTSATLVKCPECNAPMTLVKDSLKKDSL